MKKINKKKEKASIVAGTTAATAGSVGGILGALGICGFCIAPTAIAGLALISVILAVITQYSSIFLITGMVLLIFSFILRKTHQKKCKVCKAKINTEK
ncbi:MAG: hypothetical protein ABIF08_01185 [Nanoarchaeota archaeon]